MWVSITIEGTLYISPNTQLAVFRPTPGSATNSSRLDGATHLCSSTMV